MDAMLGWLNLSNRGWVIKLAEFHLGCQRLYLFLQTKLLQIVHYVAYTFHGTLPVYQTFHSALQLLQLAFAFAVHGFL